MDVLVKNSSDKSAATVVLSTFIRFVKYLEE